MPIRPLSRANRPAFPSTAKRTARALPAACAAISLWSGAAHAQTAPDSSNAPTPAGAGTLPSFTALWHQSNLLGDMGGIRSTLGNYGISLGLSETSEVLGNVSGGIHRGADYDGLTQMSLGIDTQKAFGWEGGTFNISALQIHGRDLSSDNLGTIQTASGIEADRATRLWELWYQQSFFGGRADVKIGQQSIDQEFITSQGSSLFINTMMGWPTIPSFDMPSGGPAYPLSTPGVRLRVLPTDTLTVLAGVFNGDPAGGPSADPQQRDASGTMFSVHNGVLAIGEIQYAINQPATGDMVGAGTQLSGLPGTYKLGFWYDSESFADQLLDNTGLSLANPASSGVPLMHHGDFSIYAVADQMIWRPDPQSTKSLNVFLRVMGAPPDQNAITFSANGGITLKAPFEGRDSDTAGIGFGYAVVSPRLADLERDTVTYSGVSMPIQSNETFLELTYQYQINPWWQVQPDVQYVFNPGGGIANPNNPSKRVGDEAVLGMRTVITF